MPSLSDVMKTHANPVEMLRNSQIGMYVYPVVTPEFRNWRVEQEAWRHTAVLFDQCHHMDELIVEGPQAEAFLSHHGINSFSNFGLNRAKHYVPVTPNGHVIGDHIIFREREDKFILVGRAPTSHWLMFCAATGNWNVRIKHDPRSTSRPEGERVLRTHYRYQIQGPDAPKIFEKMNGGPVQDIKFFHVDWINVGSKKVQALRHGMSGAPGLEIWGPYEDKNYIHSTIMEAARAAGVDLVQCGDFYIGWKKDDFVGKEALARMKESGTNRKKVTFEWNKEDVLKVIASAFDDGIPYKWIDFPQPNYASSSADMVMHGDRQVGMSMFNGYSYNERCVLSLGVVDQSVTVGDVLTLKWGEPDETQKTSAEKHRQAEIRVRVSDTPYAKEVREGGYASDSWRATSA